ncbi:MAG: diguanylate cyclase, partial [Thiomonas sp.]
MGARGCKQSVLRARSLLELHFFWSSQHGNHHSSRLGAFARALRSAFRETDTVYRFGGEEFMILMRCDGGCELNAAMKRTLQTIRRIRIRV